MVATLTFMFSGLLALAGLYAGGIRGIWEWAGANLCISIGIGLSYFFDLKTDGYRLAILAAVTLMAMGIGLQYSGIRKFLGKTSEWRAGLALVSIAFIQNVWFIFLHPDPGVRAIANAVLFAVGYAACARELLIRIEPPKRTAYWITGISYVSLCVLLVVRAAVIWTSHLGEYVLYESLLVNKASFFLGVMIQFGLTFGFVLMINHKLIADIHKIASRDGLTGVFNRRRLEEEAARLVVRCRRTGDALTIMMIDVDHFKSVNDRYGHQAGDEVLRRLAAVAQASIRTDDYFARYGGEEFCLMLLSTTENEALFLAERLRRNYEATPVVFSGKMIQSTISIGVADSTRVGLDFPALVAAADLALYRAKQDGRNRVVSHSFLAFELSTG